MTDRSKAEPARYFDRELSWLAFNRRVLAQGQDEATPLLERCKFLAITTSNLDEFFMIRVAGVKKQVAAGVSRRNAAGLSPSEQLVRIAGACREMITEQYRCFNEQILPALAAEGVEIIGHEDLAVDQRRRAQRYYRAEVLPILTPMTIDPGHPFPTLINNALYLAIRMDAERSRALRGAALAVIQIPDALGRFVVFRDGGRARLLPIEQLIQMHLAELFAGHEIVEVRPFRLTRDTDMELDEEATEDLLAAIEQKLTQLRLGSAVRLNVAADVSDEMMGMLRADLELTDADIYRVDGLLDLKGLWQIHGLDGLDQLKDTPMEPTAAPGVPVGRDLYEAIRAGDIFLHHPYHSFDPVLDFLQTAAEDPDVLAIKQTLYRTSVGSPVIAALKRAATNGKHVTVLVELKARLDERRNINWARELEQAGADVIYGLVGLKTHCKALLVVRREDGRLQRYVHVATGNYNETTARIYTDIGLLSVRPALVQDVSALFNVITGYSVPPRWQLIEIAPTGLRRRFMRLIEREIRLHTPQRPGMIRAKANSLSDPGIIDALYAASEAGVQIELMIRGICCLRPGVAGLSENITVHSVVDRFLEHSRIYHFHAGGADEVFISSADWMGRNLDRRIETLIPIVDPSVQAQVLEVLESGLADDRKAWVLDADGQYTRCREAAGYRSQVRLYQQARSRSADRRAASAAGATFKPRTNPTGQSTGR